MNRGTAACTAGRVRATTPAHPASTETTPTTTSTRAPRQQPNRGELGSYSLTSGTSLMLFFFLFFFFLFFFFLRIWLGNYSVLTYHLSDTQ